MSRVAWLLLACLACSGSALPPAASSTAPRSSTASGSSQASPVESRAKPPAAPAPDLDLVDRVPLWLPTFYSGLRQLSAGERKSHVRVLWLGDSHTAADFWTNAVRTPLQERFGAGGAGLVLVGIERYRHGLALLEREGRWHRVPKSPAGTRPREEGVLGLGGLGAVPEDRSATASLKVRRSAPFAGSALRWEVLFRARSPQVAFEVQPEGGRVHRVRSGGEDERASGIESYVLETRSSRELRLSRFEGSVELFGVIVERIEPGVVFDTLGINGARVGTPVSWDREAWVDEVRRRQPSLVVVAYGTNEVGDSAAAARYDPDYVELVRRARMASPEVDCLIVGPTDRARRDWTTNPRVLQIQDAQKRVASELGCAFFGTIEAMGGPGSLRRWAFEHPPRARRDRVHLTRRGYEDLGERLARRLLESYEVTYAEAP